MLRAATFEIYVGLRRWIFIPSWDSPVSPEYTSMAKKMAGIDLDVISLYTSVEYMVVLKWSVPVSLTLTRLLDPILSELRPAYPSELVRLPRFHSGMRPGQSPPPTLFAWFLQRTGIASLKAGWHIRFVFMPTLLQLWHKNPVIGIQWLDSDSRPAFKFYRSRHRLRPQGADHTVRCACGPWQSSWCITFYFLIAFYSIFITQHKR